MKPALIIAAWWIGGILIACVASVLICNVFTLSDEVSTIIGYALGAIGGGIGAIIGMDKADSLSNQNKP